MKQRLYFRIYWLLIIPFLNHCEAIRGQSFAQDSTAFKTYMASLPLRRAANLQELFAAYNGMAGNDTTKAGAPSGDYYQNLTLRNPEGLGEYSVSTLNATDMRSTLGDWSNFSSSSSFVNGPIKWKVDDPTFPDTLRRRIRQRITVYRTEIYSGKAEQDKLVRQLTAFDSLSHNKPLFFSTIYGKFGGDIKAYVDYLYKRSFLTNRFRLNVFMRWPSAKKIEQDPGVQFIMGLALYELWLKRGGKSEDKTSPNDAVMPDQTLQQSTPDHP